LFTFLHIEFLSNKGMKEEINERIYNKNIEKRKKKKERKK
jgi:hypothetical protein